MQEESKRHITPAQLYNCHFMAGNSDEETRKKYCFATQLYSKRKRERLETQEVKGMKEKSKQQP